MVIPSKRQCGFADEVKPSGLQDFYRFNDSGAITAFLQLNVAAEAALREARREVARRFGTAATPVVDFIEDPEGAPPMLLVTIKTEDSIPVLLKHLRRFRSEWWSTRNREERDLVAWNVG